MQTSLSSFTPESSPASLLPAPAAAPSALTSAAATTGQPAGGFAQVLAGASTPAAVTAPPNEASGDLNPDPQSPVSGSAVFQPIISVLSASPVVGQAAVGLFQMPMTAVENPAVTAAAATIGTNLKGTATNDSKATPVAKKDALETGDLQAMMMAMGQVMPLVSSPPPPLAQPPNGTVEKPSSPTTAAAIGFGRGSAIGPGTQALISPAAIATARVAQFSVGEVGSGISSADGQPAETGGADQPASANAVAAPGCVTATSGNQTTTGTGNRPAPMPTPAETFATGLPLAVDTTAAAQPANPLHSQLAAPVVASQANPTIAAPLPSVASTRTGALTASAMSVDGKVPDAIDATRAVNPTLAVAGAAEKFAGTSKEISSPKSGPEKDPTKSSIIFEVKQVTKTDPALGIDVAKPTATMPAGAPAHPNATDSAAALALASTANSVHSASSVLPAEVALSSTAHRAVEAVLSATDRFETTDQHSVNLQFSVGGADLNVRVEMRAGEVRTTFRTDSPELRTALSNEWQSVTSQTSGDRSVRLAPPVFTANTQGGTSFSGDGASRQRDSAPQNFNQGGTGFTTMRRGSSGLAPSTGSATPAPAVRTASANSMHLHTLA